MVLFMIQVKEVAIIGPASFRSRHEMLPRPVALFGDNLPNNFKTSVVVVMEIADSQPIARKKDLIGMYRGALVCCFANISVCFSK